MSKNCSETPTLLVILPDVAELVLEKMEPLDLLVSRKVCCGLRTAVDEFGIRFDEIHTYLHEDFIELKLDRNLIKYSKAPENSQNQSYFNFLWPAQHATIVTYEGQETRIKGENFANVAFEDLKIAIKHVSSFHIDNYQECGFMKILVQSLKSEECIHAKEITLQEFSFDRLFAILPFFDALESIQMFAFYEEFDKIMHLDQWKNVKKLRFETSWLHSKYIEHLFHLQNFYIYEMIDFSTQIAIKIRDDLMKRSTFESCEIYIREPHPIELAKVFKPDYTGGDEFEIIYLTDNLDYLITCTLSSFNAFIFKVQSLL